MFWTFAVLCAQVPGAKIVKKKIKGGVVNSALTELTESVNRFWVFERVEQVENAGGDGRNAAEKVLFSWSLSRGWMELRRKKTQKEQENEGVTLFRLAYMHARGYVCTLALPEKSLRGGNFCILHFAFCI